MLALVAMARLFMTKRRLVYVQRLKDKVQEVSWWCHLSLFTNRAGRSIKTITLLKSPFAHFIPAYGYVSHIDQLSCLPQVKKSCLLIHPSIPIPEDDVGGGVEEIGKGVVVEVELEAEGPEINRKSYNKWECQKTHGVDRSERVTLQ